MAIIEMKVDWPKTFFISCVCIMLVAIFFIIGITFIIAAPVFEKEGIHFIIDSTWSYSDNQYGLLPFISTSIIITIMALIIAIPLGLLTAIYIAEYAPAWIQTVVRSMIELLVGIPSIVYGIVGLTVLGPFIRDNIKPPISHTFGFISIFHDPVPQLSVGLFLASIILAIMILPTIMVLSNEAIMAVPREYREASYALGSTKYKTIWHAIVPAALTGIFTAIILATMRALGETMAVVLLIGGNSRIPSSIFDQGYTITTLIVNDITYYMLFPEPKSALFGAAAVLFTVEFLLVAATRLVAARKELNVIKRVSNLFQNFPDILGGYKKWNSR